MHNVYVKLFRNLINAILLSLSKNKRHTTLICDEPQTTQFCTCFYTFINLCISYTYIHTAGILNFLSRHIHTQDTEFYKGIIDKHGVAYMKKRKMWNVWKIRLVYWWLVTLLLFYL